MEGKFIARERMARSIVDRLLENPHRADSGEEVVLWTDLLAGVRELAGRHPKIDPRKIEREMRTKIQSYILKKGGESGIYWGIETHPGPQGGYAIPPK